MELSLIYLTDTMTPPSALVNFLLRLAIVGLLFATNGWCCTSEGPIYYYASSRGLSYLDQFSDGTPSYKYDIRQEDLNSNACNKEFRLSIWQVVPRQLVMMASTTCIVKINVVSLSTFILSIRDIEANHNYSSFFVGQVEDVSKISVFVFPLRHCEAKLVGKSLILYLVMISLDIDIRIGNENDTTAVHSNYTGVVSYHFKFSFFLFPPPKIDKYHVVKMYSYDLTCPGNCSCTLRHKEWFTKCVTGTTSRFLVCNRNINGLWLSRKRISTIDDGAFWCFTDLVMLFLDHNNIQTLTDNSFTGLLRLRTLKLNNNGLTMLPENVLRPLVNLRNISLDNNDLQKLPQRLFDTTRFRLTVFVLDVSGNLLAGNPANIFDKMYNVRILKLDRNRLTSLNVDVDTSFTNGIFDSLVRLRELILSYNLLSELPSGLFNKTDKLLYLDLSYNRLAFLTNNPFSSLYILQYLKLKGNALSAVIGQVFDHLINLRELHLDYNAISLTQPNLFRLTSIASSEFER